jgi:hypothetical protein
MYIRYLESISLTNAYFGLDNRKCECLENLYLHTYHSRFIPVGVAEASQIFIRDAHVLLKLFSYE